MSKAKTRRLLAARQVRSKLGELSKISFIRWRQNPALEFPPPDRQINGRNYWFETTIEAWLDRDELAA